ncbi:hypothetical protein P7K49_004911 [Saguinus oedipus]|uniref:Uncharacterized protein n=1 Tax=Saguinus oedipus TaxID=9490 RepID=A0ABQ9W8S3_SAGOE|nr:hypothetical protein P7K49_004911 [Saguinus oedipus]
MLSKAQAGIWVPGLLSLHSAEFKGRYMIDFKATYHSGHHMKKKVPFSDIRTTNNIEAPELEGTHKHAHMRTPLTTLGVEVHPGVHLALSCHAKAPNIMELLKGVIAQGPLAAPLL